jgi:hypothetical protein
MKLAYFSELEHWRRHGAPLTATPFRLHHYGAYAPEVLFLTESESDSIDHSHFPGWFNWEHNYKLKADVPLPELPDEVRSLLAEIVGRYSRKTAAEVGALSKETEPMVGAAPGHRLDLSVAAPRRPRLTVRSDRLSQAQKSLDLAQRGTRAELDARDEVALNAWLPARQRAGRAQNGMSSSST